MQRSSLRLTPKGFIRVENCNACPVNHVTHDPSWRTTSAAKKYEVDRCVICRFIEVCAKFSSPSLLVGEGAGGWGVYFHRLKWVALTGCQTRWQFACYHFLCQPTSIHCHFPFHPRTLSPLKSKDTTASPPDPPSACHHPSALPETANISPPLPIAIMLRSLYEPQITFMQIIPSADPRL